jgi:hypothetical protein
MVATDVDDRTDTGSETMALLMPLLLALLFPGAAQGQNEVARDISFQLSGSYLTPAGARAHLVAHEQGSPAFGEFTLGGDLDGAPVHGFAATAVRYTKYGHGEHDTGAPGLCPGEPVGIQCGWTIGCPILAGHSQPISCLAPSPDHGCLPATGAAGIPQCRWGNVTAAQEHCGEWSDCLGFHCSVEFQTDPSGCGDCPQPAGSWCKCREIVSCQARGNGTKLTGGGSGDRQDYAYVKAGNATGWLNLSPVLPTLVARASQSEGCHLKPGAPSPYKALCEAQQTRAACLVLNESCVWTAAPPPPPPPPAPAGARNFVFSLASGNLTFTDTGETWQQAPHAVAPMPTCAELGCLKHDPGRRCTCDPDCGERGNCCKDYNAVCLPPTPNTQCTGGAMSANLPVEECDAWLALFDATGGTEWTHCSASRTDPCGCDMGVPWAACGGQGGGLCCKRSAEPAGPGTTHVSELYLGDSNLSGRLPQSLMGLRQLRVINLACNALTGLVPPHMLDWSSFDSGRNGRCQLENHGDCGGGASGKENRFSCPIPPDAAT